MLYRIGYIVVCLFVCFVLEVRLLKMIKYLFALTTAHAAGERARASENPRLV
jgi:hypothetical protein